MSDHEPANRVVLFGGSFDPIHHGHLICAQAAAETLRADRVVFIPCGRSPFKLDRSMAPAEDRLEMCRRAAALDPRFEVSDWELRRDGPSYSVYTAQEFQRRFPPPAKLYWLIGGDGLKSLADWHRIGELAKIVTIATVMRPGIDRLDFEPLQDKLPSESLAVIREHVLDTPRIDISSTDIRARVRAGLPFEYQVPAGVAQWIREQRLYLGACA